MENHAIMDKQITRWARMGYRRVLMWDQWYDLVPGKTHRVKYDRQRPSKSQIIVVD